VHGQFGQQAVELALTADDLERLGLNHGRLQQAGDHQLGHRVGIAHAQLNRAQSPLGLAHHLLQLGPQVEDVLRVAEDQLAGFGHLQLAALLAKQRPPDLLFQQLDLAADVWGVTCRCSPAFTTPPRRATVQK
jgi:hypothetical protein